MKSQHLFQIIVVLVLIFSPLATVQASSHFDDSNQGLSTAHPPDGYVPIQEEAVASLRVESSMAATEAGANVLLVQTALPWASNADMQVLNSLGYSYDVANMSNIGSINLFSYPVILIVNDQVQQFYDQYAAQLANFESYVSSGGILVFFAAGAGWAGGQLTSPLPGGVNWNYGYDPSNYIVDATHPIVTGYLSGGNTEWGGQLKNTDLYGNYCSHGYFTNLPANAHVILNSNIWKEPTLMEYPLGKGKVIASTLTWEAYWAWYPGSGEAFAKKALDDVFLYAFSGGTTFNQNIKIDLRIEDAPDTVKVDKSAGSYVEFVARIDGNQAYQPSATIEIPADMFGAPVYTGVRNLPDNSGAQGASYTSLGNGKYQITTTLSSLPNKPQSFYKEIVWRFKIPDGTAKQENLQISATISLLNQTISNNKDTVKMDIIDQGSVIILINRQLLFNNYGNNGKQQDVSNLLAEVYNSYNFYQGEVFNLEYYGVNWTPSTDEVAANNVVNQIDGLLEGFNGQLTGTLNGVAIQPLYLLIVGGDEVIPFYRVHGPDYGDSQEFKVPGNGFPGEECPNNADPMLGALCDNYFLSDNVYADVGGGKADWERGKLELATGRIVGASAGDMRKFILNGRNATKPLKEAVLSSAPGVNTPIIEDNLNEKNVSIYGLNNPDMVDSVKFTRDDFLTAWQRSYQLFYTGVHGTYAAVSGPNTWTQAIYTNDLLAGQIQINHPLLVSNSCNLGLVTDRDGLDFIPNVDDSFMYKLANQGYAGMVASTGDVPYAPNKFPLPNITARGEKFVNQYVDELIQNMDYSYPFGYAFLLAKKNYDPLLRWYQTDYWTQLEFVYYGIPWGVMETPTNPKPVALSEQISENQFMLSTAAEATQESYSQQISVSVPSYEFVSDGNFEILQIPGADFSIIDNEPVIPVFSRRIDLPAGATVSSVSILSEQETNLGIHNIPAALGSTQYNPTSGYTDQFTVTGDYPSPRFSYEVTDYSDRTEVRVAVAPVLFNIETKNVTLYNNTTLEIQYDAPVDVLAKDLELLPIYHGNESINPSVVVKNVGTSSKTLTVTLDVFDNNGAVVSSNTTSPFTINSGEEQIQNLTTNGSLSHGGYQAVATVYENGTVLANTIGSFSVSIGNIDSFDVPPSIKTGEYTTINLTFANYLTNSVSATADVYIYDEYGIQVSKLLQRTLVVGGQSSATATWDWDPSALGSGKYYLEGVVTIGGISFTTPMTETYFGISANRAPVLTVPAYQSVQYSDPLSFAVFAADPDNHGSELVFSATGLPNDLVLTDHGDGTATISGIANVAPNTYTAQITVTDPGGLSDTKPVNIAVTKEDARTSYTGPLMVSTGCATCSTATVPLRATIQDITAVMGDPAYDPNAGNITNATVSFVYRGNANAVLCTTNVILLDPANPTVGTATCNWSTNIGSSYGVDYTIGTVVNGYYTRDSAEDDVVVVVSKPTSNFITGGGYFVNQKSGGTYAGDAGLKTNFGLNIKFTQKLTNLQGRVTIIVRQGDRVYQIKSTALNSLVVVPFSPSNAKSGTAELVGKASVIDVTDPLNPITVAGNATLNIVMKDNGEPGNADLIGISLWSKDGKLLFSSNWDGTKTTKQILDGGNLSVK